MCNVTSRVVSNATVHGVQFAVAVEIKRAKRAGLGEQAAVSWAVELVKSSITKAGVRK